MRSLTRRAHHRTEARKAWVAVAFIPVGFVLATVVGEGILSWRGYESGGDEPVPIGPASLAGGLALVVFAIPCVAAWLLGRRAIAAGEPEGRAPELIGLVVGWLFVALNVGGFVAGR